MDDISYAHQERMATALRAVREASGLILSHYQNPSLEISYKSDKTVVTQADREAEDLLRARLLEAHPHDSVLGEERSPHDGTSPYSWILDPIDGTLAFSSGVPMFGTLVALTYHSKPIAGIIHMPALFETCYALEGQGARWISDARVAANERPARASQVSKMKDALFLTTSHSGFDRIGRRDLLDRFMNASRKFRGWGSCYGHLLVLTGRADVMFDPEVKIWDCAALMPIAKEAGACYMDRFGNESIETGSSMTCAPGLKSEILEMLK